MLQPFVTLTIICFLIVFGQFPRGYGLETTNIPLGTPLVDKTVGENGEAFITTRVKRFNTQQDNNEVVKTNTDNKEVLFPEDSVTRYSESSPRLMSALMNGLVTPHTVTSPPDLRDFLFRNIFRNYYYGNKMKQFRGTDDVIPIWPARGRRSEGNDVQHSNRTRREEVSDLFWGNRGKKNDESDVFWGNRGKKSHDEELLWSNRGRRNEELNEDPPFWGNKGKKDDDLQFWGNRGKKRDVEPFWGNRGKKQNVEPFWGNRGKKEVVEPFWGNRGKKDDAELFWGNRGKKDDAEMFWGNRGKKEDVELFWGNRGKKDDDELFWDNRGKKDDAELFWGNRGKKDDAELFWGNRGKKDDDELFWGNRGKKDDDELFWGNRGKKDDAELFWGNRGKKDDAELFWGNRGKKDDDELFWGNRGKKDDVDLFWGNRGKRDSHDFFWEKKPWEHALSNNRHNDLNYLWEKINKNEDWQTPPILRHYGTQPIEKVKFYKNPDIIGEFQIDQGRRHLNKNQVMSNMIDVAHQEKLFALVSELMNKKNRENRKVLRADEKQKESLNTSTHASSLPGDSSYMKENIDPQDDVIIFKDDFSKESSSRPRRKRNLMTFIHSVFDKLGKINVHNNKYHISSKASTKTLESTNLNKEVSPEFSDNLGMFSPKPSG